jgi:putative flippase GtrA
VFLPKIFEFFRYTLVGGVAFVIDFSVLYISKTFLFYRLGTFGILLATAMGFISGLVVNYTLSISFVFKKIDEKAKQHKIRSFILFTVIGIVGLVITELSMYAGIRLFGEKWYLAVKTIIAGIVLLWNYIARKVLIFKGV